MAFKYRMIRLVCTGKIKNCDNCKDIEFSEGYCKLCGRPLWKKVDETCNFILGYVDSEFKKQGKVNIICRNCKTITTI